jgi:hypothetical protein
MANGKHWRRQLAKSDLVLNAAGGPRASAVEALPEEHGRC